MSRTPTDAEKELRERMEQGEQAAYDARRAPLVHAQPWDANTIPDAMLDAAAEAYASRIHGDLPLNERGRDAMRDALAAALYASPPVAPRGAADDRLAIGQELVKAFGVVTNEPAWNGYLSVADAILARLADRDPSPPVAQPTREEL